MLLVVCGGGVGVGGSSGCGIGGVGSVGGVGVVAILVLVLVLVLVAAVDHAVDAVDATTPVAAGTFHVSEASLHSKRVTPYRHARCRSLAQRNARALAVVSHRKSSGLQPQCQQSPTKTNKRRSSVCILCVNRFIIAPTLFQDTLLASTKERF